MTVAAGRGLKRAALAVVPAALALAVIAPLPAADCNGNGVPDGEEVAAKGADCNENGIPDDCDLVPLSLTFSSKTYSTGSFPRAPAAGDLDGDGAVDAVLVNAESDTISIFPNDGSGSFRPPVHLPAGDQPLHAVVVDLDRDGDLDLLASIYNRGEGYLSIFQNQGAGSLVDERRIEGIWSPQNFLVLDLDGDGDVDLAAPSGSEVAVFYNEGGEVFGAPRRFLSGNDSGTPGLVPLDFDRDGDVDLVRTLGATSSHYLSVLSNEGQGTFKFTGTFYSVGPGPYSLVSGDLDGDQWPDVVSFNSAGDGISVLFGDREMGFRPAVTYPPGVLPGSPQWAFYHGALLDLNGDGALDVVATDGGHQTDREHQLSIYLNLGDGGLRPPLPFQFPALVLGVAGADFNRDGRVDLALASASLNQLYLMLNQAAAFSRDCDGNHHPDECDPDCDGDRQPDACEVLAGAEDCNRNGVPDPCEKDCDGNRIPDDCDLAAGTAADCNRNGTPDSCDLTPRLAFETRQELPVGGSPRTLHAGDLDGDGELDLSLMDGLTNEAVFLYHRDGRQFAAPRRMSGQGAQSISALADLDGDGSLDLVLSDRFEKRILLFMNRGDGRFRAPVELAAGEGVNARAADLDSDGATDLVVGGKLKVHWNSGQGLFPVATEVGGGGDLEMEVADLDGDRRQDIFITDFWYRGLGNRRFAPAQQLVNVSGPLLALADFNGDGRTDVVKAVPGFRSETWVFLTETDGRLGSPVRYEGSSASFSAASLDLDGDGDLDLALGFSLLLNDGKGAFSPGGSYGSWIGWLAAGDLDRDGRPDLAMTGIFQTVDLLWNTVSQTPGPRGFQGVEELAVGISAESVMAADFDGDGPLDLALWSGGAALLRNTGAGSFTPWVTLDQSVAAIADLNRDGSLDLISTSPFLSVLLNHGGGRFGLPEPLQELSGIRAVVPSDLDGDGAPDLVALVDDTLLVLKNQGQGTFDPPAQRLNGILGPAAALDLDGDGDNDLAVGAADEASRAAVRSYRNLDGRGNFGSAANVLTGSNLESLLVADLNGDEISDLTAVMRFGLQFFAGRPEGLADRGGLQVGDNLRFGCSADFEGDGDVDLALTGPSRTTILPNLGSFTFAPPLEFLFAGGVAGIDAGDFDGDQRPELAVALMDSGRLAILRNASGATSPDRDHDGRPDDCQARPHFHRADSNHDGELDLSDALHVLQFLMLGGSAPVCRESADVNNDGALDISDGVFLLGYLFLGTRAPPEPGPLPLPCGSDPDPPGSAGDLGCDRYERC